MSVKIIVDSACDITQEKAKEMNIDVLPLKTMFGDEEFLDGVTLNHQEFFEKLIETGIMPTTSQLTPYEYGEKFKEIKEAGDTAVCITISSKLSGCYQSACVAAADYEDCITVVDSQNVSLGEQVLVEYAQKLRSLGKSAPEIAADLEEKKGSLRLIALLNTLEYLKKGGRISSAAALAGTLLSIKPVIAIEHGEVAILGKARGSKNGNNLLTEYVKQSGAIDFTMPYRLAYSGLSDSTLQKYLADNIQLYHGQTAQPPVTTIGSAIGTHVGPGAIAAAFFAK
ncbi:MAG: DegV family protein [Lachnospiraceae bacterium]|jgi:DegV family protein with EDD domain|nr:DegV family protein [Lachnospiraceae bacterium]MCI9660067.1 DegV family protein [Lachnospiraceae bacterium]